MATEQTNIMMDLEKLQRLIGVDVVPVTISEFSRGVIRGQIIGGALEERLDQMFASYVKTKWKDCLDHCDVVLDITWEHLNTGYWKDVDITWRYLYTITSWVKALAQFAVATQEEDSAGMKDSIKTCDMGLLMGAPVKDNILTRLVVKLQHLYSSRHVITESSAEPVPKKIKLDNIPDIKYDVGIVTSPSLEYFLTNHMMSEKPVVIREAMDYWPAMDSRRWSLRYIKDIAGCRTVPIEIGSKYTDDEWSQSLMTIGEFIEKHIEQPTAKKGYLAQHQLFDQIPELKKDICVPSYCGLGENTDVDINAWFGPAGTISPLHQDPKHNLLCQVVGEKYIRLYSTQYTDQVYPDESKLFSNTSQVDVENPNLVRFPDFAKAPYTECVLKTGEMLYIPPKYWHYVRSLAISFSVSFWWE